MELTEQDRAILNMLGQGHTTPQIARGLGYREGTIRNRLRQLFRLYKVKNRTQLMVQAIRCQALDISRIKNPRLLILGGKESIRTRAKKLGGIT